MIGVVLEFALFVVVAAGLVAALWGRRGSGFAVAALLPAAGFALAACGAAASCVIAAPRAGDPGVYVAYRLFFEAAIGLFYGLPAGSLLGVVVGLGTFRSRRVRRDFSGIAGDPAPGGDSGGCL